MTSSEKASLKVVIIRLILLAGLIQFNTRRKLFVTTLAIVDKNILLIVKLLIIKYYFSQKCLRPILINNSESLVLGYTKVLNKYDNGLQIDKHPQ